jgi:tetratricopeptide (TPR) repeat protein
MKNITGLYLRFIIGCFLFFSAFCFSSAAQTDNSYSGNIRPTIALADSFYSEHHWKKAADLYHEILQDTSSNALAWNRFGFSQYNLGNINDAMKAYQKSLGLHPTPLLKQVLILRMARIYAREKKYDEAINNLEEAVQAGYSNADELDSLEEFNAMRSGEKFKQIREKVFVKAYPCSAEPKSMDFDFWIGEWTVYVTGTHNLAGRSVIQRASGGCMILENWSSANSSYNGKSINFYDPPKNKWEQVWVGSEGGPDRVHRFYNGECRDSAMRFEFNIGDKGEPITGRFTFFNQGKNQVRQFKESSLDGGKTWQVDYDFTYFRNKK